jgi:hypothetical protein
MTRIPLEASQAMFDRAGIDRDKLHGVLRSLAKGHLKAAFRKTWVPENPTRFFCYVVSEYVLNFVAPPGSTAWSLVIPGDEAKHYFIRWPDGTIVDLTAEQFDDFSLVDYSKGKKSHFMYPSPSRRAREVHEAMGPVGEE